LHSNSPPSELEREAVRASLEKQNERLKEMETSILIPEKGLQEKCTARDLLREKIHRQRSVLSPLRVIPAELLSEIFVHCLPEDVFIPCRASSAPLVLTQVCQFWTEVALSSPRLW
ncbi:hypothetical protein GLOTRDRAFT_24996, partial [Gloeophyllum trabeum ATCC 11539]